MSDQEITTAFDKLRRVNNLSDPGNQRRCPECGVVLGTVVLSRLCPNCLLKQGLKGRPTEGIEPFEPLSVESLAKVMRGVEPIEFIGRGGMGAVFKGRQEILNRIVALKVMSPHAVDGGSTYHRFTREALSLARFNHRNVVRIYEFGLAGNFPYFVMDFVDGSSLRQMLKSGPLDLSHAVPLFLQLCDGLQHVHERHVIHRDIKPENLLVDKEGSLKIADFGLAKLNGGAGASSEWHTSDGRRMGTQGYMAPEQVENPDAVDHRADIYSVAVVLREMLMGKRPLDRSLAPSPKAKVDSLLDEVLSKALETDVARRYQDIREFKQAVEAVQEKICDLKCQRDRLVKALQETPGDVRVWEQLKQICDQLNDEEGSIWPSLRLFGIYRQQGRLADAILEGQKLMLRLPKGSNRLREVRQILSHLEEVQGCELDEAA